MRIPLFLFITGLVSFVWPVISAPILAIDYGTEWTKAALIKSGIPLELVLTRDTRRKEQSAIAFKGDDRLFGVDAANLATRSPSHSIRDVKELLDVSGLESSLAQKYLETHPALQLQENKESVSGVSFVVSDTDSYTVEEIIAMTMEHYINLAEEMAEEPVNDLVLTVPPHFNELQRFVLLDAARLLNKNVLALIDDGLAVALEYSLSRSFSEDTVYHIVYDAGSGSSSATLVAIDAIPKRASGKDKNMTRIRSLASSTTLDLSGNELNRKIMNFMKEAFQQKHNIDLSHNNRALARLEKESLRVKHVLSANSEAYASIEELAEGIDFRLKITRSVFESLCQDLAIAAVLPIKEALVKGNISLEILDSVILHGGTSRVPFIQSAIADYVTSDKVSKNVNADEASVKGAAFYGASFTSSFRVKPVLVQGAVYRPYSLTLSNMHSLVALPDSTPYGSSHLVAMNISDLGTHPSLPVYNDGTLIGEISINNLTEALKQADSCSEKHVLFEFSVDSFKGIFTPVHSYVACENKSGSASGIGGKVKSLFNNYHTGKLNEEALELHNLGFVYKRYKELSDDSLQRFSDRLALRSLKDKNKVLHESALNEYESLLYRAQSLSDDDEILIYANSEEAKALKQIAVEDFDWLIEVGPTADTNEVLTKQKKLNDILHAISYRHDENQKFKMSFENLNSTMERAEALLSSFDIPSYPLTEYDEKDVKRVASIRNSSHKKLSEQYGNITSWLDDNLKKHVSRAEYEDPVITTSEMDHKTKKLQNLVYEYLRRSLQHPKLKPKTKVPSSSSQATPSSEKADHEITESSKSFTESDSEPTSTETLDTTTAKSTSSANDDNDFEDEL
ncbi:heat shock protein Lhs1 [Schizosaccharomyces cryophilus OY26]|uniref:Heat shock protein Lhs1 n=1 Tax=Schizosaccharomyces cryophilus (strain OY26 / ATCC MYA-4695 / CBS 11777 / NBRC 106824 / NRRL Y48691) TaxID=653667 RepID=S9X6D1_SCHCR|nr:heat shock protein Lhs1 [Schizosaccharomyces cryophilus OY26]EPY52662.1 heat shock protein Lhs1 [Schizosaccharomyces cryophilus OY26]